MLQVARLAPNLLHDSAENVVEFVNSNQSPAGGFLDRYDQPDLYYTVFGMGCLRALQQDLDTEHLASYLNTIPIDSQLDLVHTGSLANCYAGLETQTKLSAEHRHTLIQRILAHRTSDGGFNQSESASEGSAYGCFMALGALQDLGQTLDDPETLNQCLDSLATRDGGFTNDRDITLANVPATAAAITVKHQLGVPVQSSAGDFLMNCVHEDGGFFAIPDAPMPDLLSTAVALHALSCLGRSIDTIRDKCLDFIDTLWTARGGFYGNWAEDEDDLDVEYTWYGLLALGHLSV